MKIKKNISLKNFTTFKIGGKAKFFVKIKNTEELKKAVNFTKEKNLPFFVLGCGSNLLINDKGYDGLVIKNEIKGITFEEVSSGIIRVVVGAGEKWDDLVKKTVECGLWGIENLSGIPSTVGAASVQNIGAYGVEVKNIIDFVEVFDTKNGEVKKLTANQCEFGYRQSIFKKEKGKKFIVMSVSFILKKTGKADFEYKDMQKYFGDKKIQKPSLIEIRKATLLIRKSKLPDLKHYGTAGSFFKNPIIKKERADKLLKKYPLLSIPVSKIDFEYVKISAAYLLDNICGYKGIRKGGVGVYENHTLVLVNYGDGKAKEVKNLAEEMQKCIKEKTGIILEPEVVFVGF